MWFRAKSPAAKAAKKAKSTPWTAVEQLAALPLRNAAAVVVSDEPRRLVLRIALVHGWLARLTKPLTRIADHQSWELLDVDLLLHRWSDGRTTVEDMISRLAREEHLGWNEARALVLSYLRRQTERSLLVVGKPR